MTPSQIEQAARERYNSVGDRFYSQAEILQLIFDAEMELARECLTIEETYTTSTVADQREYAIPTNCHTIRRVEYSGRKLTPIAFVEDDALTANNMTTTASGTPEYYSVWGDAIYLRPIPSAVGTLKIYSYDEPTLPAVTSTLKTPSIFHNGLINFVVGQMCAKDENAKMVSYYMGKWEADKAFALRYMKKRRRGDGFASVKDEESLPTTMLGPR